MFGERIENPKQKKKKRFFHSATKSIKQKREELRKRKKKMALFYFSGEKSDFKNENILMNFSWVKVRICGLGIKSNMLRGSRKGEKKKKKTDADDESWLLFRPQALG